MSVHVIDPNKANTNRGVVNAIPQYQDMYIFAELTAQPRPRTTLIANNYGLNEKITVENYYGNGNNLKPINFLGSNQGKDGEFNQNVFSTNYYEGSVGDNVQYEGFGINSIKITTNSSFIPQVNIQFVDIRGLTFFNQKNSPYRILFDFPPPIFQLTIKGYYGGALTYHLHLVKYTSEFNSENGNFVIDAEFVAMTFAPLADIPFSYVVRFPMINKDLNISSADNTEPTCTYDLIQKLKRLYSQKAEITKDNQKSAEFDKLKTKEGNINDIFNYVRDYKIKIKSENVETNQPDDDVKLFSSRTIDRNADGTAQSVETVVYTPIRYLTEFDSSLNKAPSAGLTSTGYDDKLYVGYCNTAYVVNSNDTTTTPTMADRNATKKDALNVFRDGWIKIAPLYVTQADIKPATEFKNNNNEYVLLDITTAYAKMIKESIAVQKEKAIVAVELTNNINQFVQTKLGMIPTVKNVFSIILRDVDIFFQKLKDTSLAAEAEHKTNTDLIISQDGVYGDVEKGKVYSFPLLLNEEKRVGPIEINNMLNGGFATELNLINAFISTYKDTSDNEINSNNKNEKNADGTSKWIPYSPFDSKFFNGISNSPYQNANSLDQVFGIILNRFYMISEFVFKADFYTNKDIVETFSKTEAINLISSMNSEKLTGNIKTLLKSSAAELYNNFNKYSKDKFSFPAVDNIDGIYSDRKNEKFNGVKIINVQLTERVDTSSPTTPIDKYWSDRRNYKYVKEFLSTNQRNKLKNTDFVVSEENLLLIKNTNTDFIPCDFLLPLTSYDYDNSAAKISAINMTTAFGNRFDGYKKATASQIITPITQLWASALENHYNSFIGLSNKTKSILYLSNFGLTASPFNVYGNNLNGDIFNTVGVVNIPSYLLYYIGALVDIISVDENGVVNNDMTTYNELKTYFTDNYKLTIQGVPIFADMYDINNRMSKIDKQIFKSYYEDVFFKNEYEELNGVVVSAVEKHNNDNSIAIDVNVDTFKKIMLTPYQLLNCSEITFSLSNTADNGKFESLVASNLDTDKKTMNDLFFTTFLKEIDNQFVTKEIDNKKKDEAFKKLAGDVDIINETYYSFKNINDKWIAGTSEKTKGYPFNLEKNNGKMIDLFKFVDRTMTDIGDKVIINPEHLIEMFEDTSTNLYTVLTSLLSLNGFEFFPLQNFMNITNDGQEWENCFIINTESIVDSSPAFVCVYIGGTSAYSTGIEDLGVYKDQFKDDGITDLENPEVKDFNETSNVRAFRVRFAEQDQSMFKDIKIDSKEYPETNESIQILARLAGDQGANPPVPKGQNLYNLYEKRSYKATVGGLGNAMIQPTQYFQLENVPIFNGVYIILGVEHNIVPNNMKTSFYGTKILKYPVPYVANAASIVGFEGASSIQTSGGLIGDSNVSAAGADKISFYGQYNSMYNRKIDAETKLTQAGKDFIKKKCDGSNCLSGTKGPLYCSVDQSTNKPIDKIWIANAKYHDYRTNKDVQITASNWGDVLIYLLEYYGTVYKIDPNLIAAQMYNESEYKIYNYPSTTTAASLSQMISSTFFDQVISNKGNSQTFTATELTKLTKGFETIKLANGDQACTTHNSQILYTGFGNIESKYELNSPSRKFRGILFQNIIDNPDLTVKAMFRHMKNLSNGLNNMSSNSLFAYYNGSGAAKSKYRDTLLNNNFNVAKIAEGGQYVYKVWKLLATEFKVPNVLSSNDVLSTNSKNPGFDPFKADTDSSA